MTSVSLESDRVLIPIYPKYIKKKDKKRGEKYSSIFLI